MRIKPFALVGFAAGSCTEKSILIGTYLAIQDSTVGAEFQLKCLRAKEFNSKVCEGDYSMTPQEELFKQFFQNEKQAVASMSLLELRAHREELARIAFEARARLTAADDEIKEKAKSAKGITGFSGSIEPDQVSTDAINAIKSRAKKMSKEEKLKLQLEKLGLSTKDASELISAGAVLGRVKANNPSVKPTELVPSFNPFAKHPNPIDENGNPEPVKTETVVSIQEETNTIIIKEEVVEAPKPAFKNPFAK